MKNTLAKNRIEVAPVHLVFKIFGATKLNVLVAHALETLNVGSRQACVSIFQDELVELANGVDSENILMLRHTRGKDNSAEK